MTSSEDHVNVGISTLGSSVRGSMPGPRWAELVEWFEVGKERTITVPLLSDGQTRYVFLARTAVTSLTLYPDKDSND